jgi:hypothetical protein
VAKQGPKAAQFRGFSGLEWPLLGELAMTRTPTRNAPTAGLALICVGAIAAGCVGEIGNPLSSSTTNGTNGSSGNPGGPGSSILDAPTKFTCDPTQKPPLGSLRAKSALQYQNTISDLASWAMKDAKGGATVLGEVSSAMASLQSNFPSIPQNDLAMAGSFPDGGWLRADQDQQFTRVQAFYNIGVAVAKSLTAPSRLGTVVGSCATDGDPSNDATCLTTFIQTFGARALGRPITTDDVTFYTDVYGSPTTADPAAYQDVITVMLNAPEFIYAVEHGDQPVAGLAGVYTLSAHELAGRLAYHVWDTMPDDELWAAAEDGSLLQDAVYQKEAARLFADPRGMATMKSFFSEYIQVASVGGPRGTGGLNYHDLTQQDADPRMVAFAGSDLPSAALEQHMVDDAMAMLAYFTWTKPGTIHDLLTSPLSFAQTSDVANIYGVPAWDGTSTPASFPDGQRPGLFTRALFVSAGLDTAPILKGVYLRRYLLCDTIGPPPAAAMKVQITPSATLTTRQEVEGLTSGVPCNSCHPHWLNPLGFATEDFDGLGRHRTEQTLYNTDGSVATKLPVDTAVTPYVKMGDGTTTAKDVVDLMSLIETSEKPAACLARNYFRFTFARFESLTADACTLETIRSKLDGGGHLADMLAAVVSAPAFKQRTFQ